MNNALQNLDEFYKESCCSFFAEYSLFERQEQLQNSLIKFSEKQSETAAEEVFGAFLFTYRLPGLQDIISAMRKFEVLSARLVPIQRDHYIHSVNVFLLGLSIFARSSKLKSIASSSMEYADMYSSIGEEFLFRWGLTSLFHDVGYPLEIAYKTIHEFTTMLISPSLNFDEEEVVFSKGSNKGIKPVAVLNIPYMDDLLYIKGLPPKKFLEREYFAKYPNLRELPNDLLLAISSQIARRGFASADVICKRIRREIEESLQRGVVDHGIYSSIIFLKWINEAFYRSSWNPAYFYIPVMHSASAILLHNSHDYIFQVPPFNLCAVDCSEDFLTYLLILCDRIQETNRACYGYSQHGGSFSASRLKMENDSLALVLLVQNEDDLTLANLKIQSIRESLQKAIALDSLFKDFSISINLNP